jgi:hypothetical protein
MSMFGVPKVAQIYYPDYYTEGLVTKFLLGPAARRPDERNLSDSG